jgi:hypothetical protein
LAVDLFPVSFTAFRGVSGKFLGSSMTGEVWRAPQPVISGVYFLFKDRALTYTGKSRDVYARIETHRSNGRQFDYAAVTACPEQDAAWIEAAMIRAMNPPENRALKAKVRAPALPSEGLSSPVRYALQAPPKRTDVLPSDPDMIVSRPVAVDYAKHFRLGTQLIEALKTGEIPSRRERDGRGAFLIRVGDLETWRKKHAVADATGGVEAIEP